MTIKPIPTRAYGCRFRSRLEARWAVFFTAAGWDWEYEPEGFDLPSGWYLPDFVITEGAKVPEGARRRSFWVEVKPGEYPEPAEELKTPDRKRAVNDPEMDVLDPRWVELYQASGRVVFILRDLWRPGKPPYKIQCINGYRCVDPRCKDCRSGMWAHPMLSDKPDMWFPSFDPGLRKAFEAATSARFEHGEAP